MDFSPIHRRTTSSAVVESWDDDDDLEGTLEIKSSAMSVTGARSRADRESISSRMSFKSDGGFDFDEDLPDTMHLAQERSSAFALESAKRAGIPLPQDLPSSALMGGSIKRLGSKQTQTISHDDWFDDLEIPMSGPLAVKTAQFTEFSNKTQQKPTEIKMSSPNMEQEGVNQMLANVSITSKNLNTALNKYRESDTDDWDEEEIPTLRVPLKPASRKGFMGLLSPPLSASKEPDDEGFDGDFELPEGTGFQLQLKQDQNRAPAVLMDSDFEEWVEGTRQQGGTHRARSARSSSASMMSPSLSSVNNFESDDEGLEGLQLPEGPINFEEILEKRKQNESPDITLELEKTTSKEDFLTGLEIGNGDIFDPAKLTLNRNVKHKTARKPSPNRGRGTALTFANLAASDAIKSTSTVPTNRSRIPRYNNINSSPAPSLESVAESRSRRDDHSRNRYSGPPVMDHNAFGQMGSFFHPHPTPPPSIPSSTARPRKRPSLKNLQQSPPPQPQPPTTTSAQLLRMKRSMSTIPRQLPTSPGRNRPPSRTDTPTSMSLIGSTRPTTPSEKRELGPAALRRPFIPGGTSVKSSHNVNVKATNRLSFRAPDDTRPNSRLSNSRHTRDTPPPATRSGTIPASALESLRKEATKLITKPAKKRNFGDGTELEGIDDLPTSQKVEQKFMKEPVGKGAPRVLRARNAAGPTQIPPPPAPSVTTTRAESTPSKTPNFARDTAASRTAREIGKNWKQMIAAKGNKAKPAPKKAPQQRPHLIKPLGNQSGIPKAVKGMTWNPSLYLWEGNEGTLEDFDRHQAVTPPRPALITNINGNNGISKGIQVVGGMVFDPQRMCWLKMDEEDDEDDPFEGVDDLMDEVVSVDGTNVSGLGTSCGEWMVGEEFDVGPEFVRRQREEEERWRRRVDGWVGGSMAGLAGQRNEHSEWRRMWELWAMVKDT